MPARQDTVTGGKYCTQQPTLQSNLARTKLSASPPSLPSPPSSFFWALSGASGASQAWLPSVRLSICLQPFLLAGVPSGRIPETQPGSETKELQGTGQKSSDARALGPLMCTRDAIGHLGK
ncbi:hypothetical protein GX50_04382 [[Emmonsia] crescens]|uniref:Uncharacterized protein n=1 Tax=[Emmonsia] crescens TaxID=73230 RepID=A0A2B7ZIL1_9EURO|nr:hypothetical protein GX50_04382 [Emmonsia crescens]